MDSNKVTVFERYTNKTREAIAMTKKDFYFSTDSDSVWQKKIYKESTEPEGPGYAVIYEAEMPDGTGNIHFYPMEQFNHYFKTAQEIK